MTKADDTQLKQKSEFLPKTSITNGSFKSCYCWSFTKYPYLGLGYFFKKFTEKYNNFLPKVHITKISCQISLVQSLFSLLSSPFMNYLECLSNSLSD